MHYLQERPQSNRYQSDYPQTSRRGPLDHATGDETQVVEVPSIRRSLLRLDTIMLLMTFFLRVVTPRLMMLPHNLLEFLMLLLPLKAEVEAKVLPCSVRYFLS